MPYAAALSGFIAVIFPILWITAYGIWESRVFPVDWWQGPTFLFMFLSPPAVVVMAVAGTSLGFLIRRRGLTSRWLYIAATFSIVGGCYLLLALMDPRFADLELVPLIPMAAIPSGLFFHRVAHMRNVPPLDWRDGLIAAMWIAGWTFTFIVPHHAELPHDPWQQRFEVLDEVGRVCLPVFTLSGVLAGIARLWSVRVGMGILVLAWLIPAFFTVEVFSTPLGPTHFHYSLADQEFEIDWRLNPRGDSSKFCIDPHDSGLFTGFRSENEWGLELCVSRISDPLVPDLPPLPGDKRESGLTCKIYNVEVGETGKVCSAADAEGRTITKIRCPPGWCSLWFDADELRYSLTFSPSDFASWSELQKRAVQIIAKLRLSEH